MYSARRELLCRTVYFIKEIEQSETTLRNFAVHYSAVLRFAFKKPSTFYPKPYTMTYLHNRNGTIPPGTCSSNQIFQLVQSSTSIKPSLAA